MDGIKEYWDPESVFVLKDRLIRLLPKSGWEKSSANASVLNSILDDKTFNAKEKEMNGIRSIKVNLNGSETVIIEDNTVRDGIVLI